MSFVTFEGLFMTFQATINVSFYTALHIANLYLNIILMKAAVIIVK